MKQKDSVFVSRGLENERRRERGLSRRCVSEREGLGKRGSGGKETATDEGLVLVLVPALP